VSISIADQVKPNCATIWHISRYLNYYFLNTNENCWSLEKVEELEDFFFVSKLNYFFSSIAGRRGRCHIGQKKTTIYSHLMWPIMLMKH
jgi:hypothetical protein